MLLVGLLVLVMVVTPAMAEETINVFEHGLFCGCKEFYRYSEYGGFVLKIRVWKILENDPNYDYWFIEAEYTADPSKDYYLPSSGIDEINEYIRTGEHGCAGVIYLSFYPKDVIKDIMIKSTEIYGGPERTISWSFSIGGGLSVGGGGGCAEAEGGINLVYTWGESSVHYKWVIKADPSATRNGAITWYVNLDDREEHYGEFFTWKIPCIVVTRENVRTLEVRVNVSAFFHKKEKISLPGSQIQLHLDVRSVTGEDKFVFEAPQQKKGLIAYYSFDNILHDKLYDGSGNGHSGILHNVKIVEGIEGEAAEFNGNAYIDLGDSLTGHILDEVTVSAFIKPQYNKPEPGRPEWPNMIFYDGSDGEFQLVMYYDRVEFKVKLNDGNWYAVSYKIPKLNEWYHVAGVYSRFKGALKLYVNGDLVDEKKIPSLPLYDPTKFGEYNPTIGAFCSDKGDHWSYYIGAIDELRIYDKALSYEEIKELYSEVRKNPQPKIVDVEYPRDINLGDWITVKVEVTNSGGIASWQTITVSLPDLEGCKDYSLIKVVDVCGYSVTDQENEQMYSKYLTLPNNVKCIINVAGDEALGGYSGKVFPERKHVILQYPRVEIVKNNVKPGDRLTLTFKVKPKEAGQFRLYVRTVAGGWDLDKTAVAWDPKEGILDQQGEYIKIYVVNVNKGKSHLKGDLNGNGILDTGDATIIKQMVAGLRAPNVELGDLNGNGIVDTGDATLILKKVTQEVV